MDVDIKNIPCTKHKSTMDVNITHKYRYINYMHKAQSAMYVDITYEK